MKQMLIILLFVLMTLLVVPALAQDATPEAAPVTVDAPVENLPSADPAITLKWWQVLAGLFTAAGAGGLVGIAGVGTLANRIKNDAATMAAIEGLAKSVPADVAKLALNLARSSEAIAGVVEEAFDGVPAVSKQVTIDQTHTITTATGGASAG